MPSMPPPLLLAAVILATSLTAWWHGPALVLLLPGLLCLALAKAGRLRPAAGVAASIFLTLFCIEVSLALVRPPGGSQLTEHEAIAFRANRTVSDVGRLPLPGRYPARLATLDGALIYDVVYTIGPDGFRVTPGTDSDDPMRINVLGGSFVFGQGLEDDQTLPFHLAGQLDHATKNFGFMGWGPHQALVILLSERDTRGAVNVLLTAPWHAPRATCSPDWSGGSPRFRLASDGSLLRDGVCPENDPGWLRNWLWRLRVVVLAERVHAVLVRERTTRDQLALYVALIDRIAAVSREHGQDFVVAYIGADELNGVPLDNTELKRRLAASGATVVDVSLAASEAELSPAYYLHALDRHPSALANKERARRLTPVLAPLLKE
jgi:hypothetical protein